VEVLVSSNWKPKILYKSGKSRKSKDLFEATTVPAEFWNDWGKPGKARVEFATSMKTTEDVCRI
jgi:hypothetical protein